MRRDVEGLGAARSRTCFADSRNILRNYRSRLLSRSDFLITILLAIALTAAIFAIALFIRYGRAMAHDFREILGARMHGGSVSVLAFALLFLPIFLWLGPVWLVFYWFIIFFGYAKRGERILIVVFSLLLAAAPVLLDLASHWIAGVDSPVVMSAIASERAQLSARTRCAGCRSWSTSSLTTPRCTFCSATSICRMETSSRPASTTAVRRSCTIPPART